MSKTTADWSKGEITYVSVKTMAAVPKLTDSERAELLASIKEAEADIAAGRFIEFGHAEFGPWLRRQVENIRRKKNGGL